MIKVFHEAPVSIFKDVQAVTDGDYALVNLFETHLEYYRMMRDAVMAGREVILDNGVFELGEAFDSDRFAWWVERLEPAYYIVPDVLEDGPATLERFTRFRGAYKNLPGKVIGVAQGANMDEFIRCYQMLEPHCDKIGISFDCSWYRDYSDSSNPWVQLMQGRQYVLRHMNAMGYINRDKPHHLLGVALPQDMEFYRGTRWIDSVDTSNPVVHGLKGIRYRTSGLHDKETQKLYTLISAQVNESQRRAIMANIEDFRRYCNG